MEDVLHIRCGSDIQRGLDEVGIAGAFLDFSDPYCQGPVEELDEAAFIEARADFVASAFGLDAAQVRKKHRLRYAKLANAAAYGRIVLWFEHDSYDQLILAYLLKHFGALEERPELELVCIDDWPVEPRFIGLGQLGPDDLATLCERRQAVTGDQLKLGAAVWAALVEPSPQNLVRLVEGGAPALPIMARALKRHLQELPAKSSGLSLTEEISLKALADRGALTGGALFRVLTLELEPLPYLGDTMYWYDLGRLIAGGAINADDDTLDWGERTITLTELGRACLEGRADWLDHVTVDRFVGGIRVARGEKGFRRQG